MISRSLGPEFGGSIGLIFALANAVGAAMYVVGFSETVRDLMAAADARILDGGTNDIRLVGLATALVLMGVCLIGTGFESRMQMGLLAILLVSLLNYIVGTLIPPSEAKTAVGITGYSSESAAKGFGCELTSVAYRQNVH